MEISKESSPVRHMLVPVDFSESSRAALRLAHAMAQPLGATIDVVHVIEREHGAPAVAGEAELVAARHLLDELVASTGPVHAQRLEVGHVQERILAMADAGHFDLIVMGTAGRTGRPRSLAGSVAESVMRMAGCPVLTIRG